MNGTVKGTVGILALIVLTVCLDRWFLMPAEEPLPVISLPASVQAQPYLYFAVTAKSQGSDIRWVVDPGLRQLDPQLVADKSVGLFVSLKPGAYTIRAYTATRNSLLPWAKAMPSELAECKVMVGDVPPEPEPVPPSPPVPPKPPTPSVNPFPGSPLGLRVAVLYDQTKLLPKDIQPIITSTKLRSFLDANCAKQGNWPEYRFFDRATPMVNESALWQGIMAKYKDKDLSRPLLLIGNGSTGFEGPIADSVDGVIATVQKYVAPQRSELPRIRQRRETLWTLGV